MNTNFGRFCTEIPKRGKSPKKIKTWFRLFCLSNLRSFKLFVKFAFKLCCDILKQYHVEHTYRNFGTVLLPFLIRVHWNFRFLFQIHVAMPISMNCYLGTAFFALIMNCSFDPFRISRISFKTVMCQNLNFKIWNSVWMLIEHVVFMWQHNYHVRICIWISFVLVWFKKLEQIHEINESCLANFAMFGQFESKFGNSRSDLQTTSWLFVNKCVVLCSISSFPRKWQAIPLRSISSFSRKWQAIPLRASESLYWKIFFCKTSHQLHRAIVPKHLQPCARNQKMLWKFEQFERDPKNILWKFEHFERELVSTNVNSTNVDLPMNRFADQSRQKLKFGLIICWDSALWRSFLATVPTPSVGFWR